MKKLNKYDDFLFDSLFEGISDGEMPFVLSIRLAELIYDLDHTIAKKLLNDDTDKSYTKITLLDYDDNRADMFTFTSSPKLIQHYKDVYDIDGTVIRNKFRVDLRFEDKDLWDKNRSFIKIGRLITKLYPGMFPANGKPGEDIESFVDLIKTSRTKTEGEFKIVKGKDIVKYYDKSSYESNIEGSTLAGSCMAGSYCSRYIEFYADNDVEMVILMSDKEKDKIIGRAILWKINKIMDKYSDEYRDLFDSDDNVKVGNETERIFMDRIYYTHHSDLGKFKELAKKNDWLSKDTQDFDPYTSIHDPRTNTSKSLLMYTKIDEDYSGPYPYMDTMKYYNTSTDILSNSSYKHDRELTSTGGGYDEPGGSDYLWNDNYGEFVNHDDMYFSEIEDRYLEVDDSIYIESMNDYVSRDYADENLVYSEDEENWLKIEDSVYIESKEVYVSQEYADDNYAHCSYDGKWYDYEDSYPSNKWGAVPIDNAVKVFTTIKINWEDVKEEGDSFDVGDYADWRVKDDNSYFDISNSNGKVYHFSNEFENELDRKNVMKIINEDI